VQLSLIFALTLWEGQMSLSNAEMHGRRARDAGDFSEVGDNVKRAIDMLVREIKQLEARVANLEAQMHRR
jgi:hypothetical protein